MTRSNITLSNRLIVPAGIVRQHELRRFYYSWKENAYSLEENEFGEVVLDEFEEPKKQKDEVAHALRSYREIFSKSGENFISFPRGNLEKIEPLLRNGYRDLRPVIPLGFHLRLNEAVQEDHRWPDQARCVNEYMQRGYGIIEGDTGSGKTIVGIAVLCALGMPTLILSPQRDGTDQWIEEIEEHTNIKECEELLGRKLLGPYKARNKKNFFPITVGTGQAFFKPTGRRWLYEHRNDFGLLMIDEVHDFAAPQFLKVIQAVNSFSPLGLTATVERPDRRQHLLFDTVGPVVAKGTAKQMPPTVYFVHTGVDCPTWQYRKNFPKHYQWKVVLEHLMADEDRYELIQKYLQKDADNKRVIACISQRTKVVKKLYRLLSQDGYDVRYVDGKTPKGVRKMIYKEVRQGKVQILFAGKVLNQLVNLPVIDCLHFVTPSSSPKATKQGYGRARRWLAGKKNPIIRDYVDDGGNQIEGAYKNRMRLCRSNGWTVKVIESGIAQQSGMSMWKKHGKKK